MCKSVHPGRKMGFKAASFEMTDSPTTENILSGIGFAYGLALTLRLLRNVAWPGIHVWHGIANLSATL